MAKAKMEECMAVLTGAEPVDNSKEYAQAENDLATAQVHYKAARPDTKTADKVNLKTLEKKRRKAQEAGLIESQPFAEEKDGVWTMTAARQKEQPVVKNAPKPEPQKEEKAEEKAEETVEAQS